MSEQEEQIHLNFIYPPNKPVQIQTSALISAHKINMIFRLSPQFVFITKYDLVTKNGSIFDQGHDFSKDIESPPKNQKLNQISITVKNGEYNESTAIAHAQNLARICFTLSSHRQFSDCRQSVAGWISRTFAVNPPDVDDLSGIYPEKFTSTDLPRPIKFMELSKEELTMKERIEKILLKLDVITCEHQSFPVYCTAAGWSAPSQSEKKVFPTLHHLFSAFSKHYSDCFSFVAEKWCNLMAYEREPGLMLNKTTLYDERKLTKQGKIAVRSRLRLFDETDTTSLFSSLSLDDLLSNLSNESDITSSKGIYSYTIEKQYAQKAAKGIEMIKRGNLDPYDSQNYVWKSFFIASLEYLAELQGENFSTDTANRNICNEILSYNALTAICPPNLRIVRSIIIDYFTDRWVAQSIIPGLLTQQSKIIYGHNLSEERECLRNEEFDAILSQIAKNLGIGPSPVKGTDKPIFCSSELNGVMSTDGNFYAIDFHRITPRDANYPDPIKDHGCIIRKEAISTFALCTELEKHDEELTALGGDKQFLYHPKQDKENPMTSEQIEKLETRRQEIIEQSEGVSFDINALTIESAAEKVPDNIIQLSKFLTEVIIPKFISENVGTGKHIIDGSTIVKEMHSRGINVRYLGHIYKAIEVDQNMTVQKKAFLVSVESEIISRSFKVIVRTKKLGVEEFLSQLNLLLGLRENESEFDLLYVEITQKSKEKFNFEPQHPTKDQRILILRSVQKAFGITLFARDYANSNDMITINDISSLSPVMKYPFTENPQFQSYVDLATTVFNNEDMDTAIQLFSLALQISEDSIHPCDERIAFCYFYLSLIYQRKGDFDAAFANCLKSLIIQEKSVDQLSPEIIVHYFLLSQYAHKLGNDSLAFAFADRAAKLASIITPNHFSVSPQFFNAAQLAMNVNPGLALKYCESRILKSESKIDQASYLDLMAKAALENSKLDIALQFEKQAVNLNPENQDYKDCLDLILKSIQALSGKPAHQ